MTSQKMAAKETTVGRDGGVNSVGVKGWKKIR